MMLAIVDYGVGNLFEFIVAGCYRHKKALGKSGSGYLYSLVWVELFHLGEINSG